MQRQFVTILLFLWFLVPNSLGCVRRRLSVRTHPAGASVYVDKQYIGASPTATSVTYYGTREIEVVRDGYRTEKVLRSFNPPWYQLPPLDFISETLWPREIRDERIVDIAMVPQQVMTSEQLQSRANNLRLQAAQGVATPLPPPLNSGAPIATVGPGQPNYPGAGTVPMQPSNPVYPPATGATPTGSTWQPGQFLRNFFQPEGSPPTRIPEAGILPGGGYRPEI